MILRAIDLTIADVEAADGPNRDEQLETLFEMRERLMSQATQDSPQG